jgi:autotransporter-associated beta strand protein/T5SS/PEP-CTERM-associated repeat protein
LRLGGTTNASFDVSRIGASAQYQNFGVFRKIGASTWTLTGTTAAVTPWAINAGTLSIQNGGALGSTTAGTTVASGATLQLDGDPTNLGASITVGNPLNLAGTGFNGNGALRNLTGNNTLAGTVTLSADSRIRAEAATQLTVTGQITGAGNLEASGPGTLVLTNANNYTGATTVSAGVLNIRNAAALGTTAGGTAVASGATLQLQGGIAVGNEALSLAGAGFSGAGALQNVSGNNSWSGPITLTADSTIGTSNGPDALTLSGQITGGGGLTKIGAGTLTLSGSSSYSGATAVDAGTLQARATNAFSSSSAFTVATGATLDLNSFNQTIGSLAGAGQVTNSAPSFAALTAGGNNTSTTFSGILQDGVAGGFLSLTKVGSGTLTLSGVNTYSGGTTINAGTLAVSADNNLGNGGLAFGGGILQFLSGFGSSRTVTLNAGGGTFDTNGNSASLAGNIGGTGGLTKIGAGTLTLSGNNSYLGATNINTGTLVAASGTALPGQTAVTVNSGATLAIADGVAAQIGSLADGLSGGGGVAIGSVNASTLLIVAGNASTTFSGAFSGAGSLELDNAASLTLTGASNGGNIGTIGNLTLCGGCASGGLTINGGSLTVDGGGGAIAGVEVAGGTLSVINGGTLQAFSDLLDSSNMIVSGAGSTVTVSGFTGVGIFAPGALTIGSDGVLNSQGGAEIDASSGAATATVTGIGSTWNVGAPLGFSVGGGTSSGPGFLTISSGGGVNSAGAMVIGDSAGGTSAVTVTGTGSKLTALGSLAIGATGCGCSLVGTLVVADGGVVNSPGATSIGAGSTLKLGTGGLAGTIVTPAIDNAGLIAANFTDTLTLSAAISDVGALSKSGTGTLILTGTSTYTGATTVNAGKLTVNGAIAGSAVTVNSGGTLAGTGTVGATTIKSGGTFAPGNSPGTMSVAGNLAFQSGALYLVQVTPSIASSANVSGTAALTGGSVQTLFAPGSYLTKSYDILHAAGGLGGTTFGGVSGNVPPGFTESLSYTATDAFLNLTAVLGALGTGGLSGNQQNVANGLNTFFNSGGTLPPNFLTIFGLTGGNLGNALTFLSGEAATGAQQGAFGLGGQFLGVMLDPFVDGWTGFGGAAPAMGFAPERLAPERAGVPDEVTLAYAAVLKAPPKKAPTFEQRWSAWASAYGGTNNTGGDPAVAGSHDLSARAGGVAAGFDYRVTRDTVLGFALAGGGTNWGLAQGLGGGNSDAFQAGAYGATRLGPAYLAAAFAFTNHWTRTDRIAFAGDHLTASFNAQSLGGRVEGGYRLASLYGAFTPYAALQAQSFRTPSYAETDVSGGGFALSYNARTATDTRSELGARFDHRLLLAPDVALIPARGSPGRMTGSAIPRLPHCSRRCRAQASSSTAPPRRRIPRSPPPAPSLRLPTGSRSSPSSTASLPPIPLPMPAPARCATRGSRARVPGAPQHEVLRCRPGIVRYAGIWNDHASAARHSASLRVALRPGRTGRPRYAW